MGCKLHSGISKTKESWVRLVWLPLFSKSHCGFSNEDNCCQSQGIGKSIQETFLKVLSELINLLMSLQMHNIRFLSSLLWTSANKQLTFLQESFFGVLIFFQNHAWKLGVRLIQECGLYMYTSLYSTCISTFSSCLFKSWCVVCFSDSSHCPGG